MLRQIRKTTKKPSFRCGQKICGNVFLNLCSRTRPRGKGSTDQYTIYNKKNSLLLGSVTHNNIQYTTRKTLCCWVLSHTTIYNIQQEKLSVAGFCHTQQEKLSVAGFSVVMYVHPKHAQTRDQPQTFRSLAFFIHIEPAHSALPQAEYLAYAY